MPIKLMEKEEKEKAKQQLLKTQPQSIPPKVEISVAESEPTPTPPIEIPPSVTEKPTLQAGGQVTVLVPPEKQEVPTEAYEEFERRDEKQIEKELLGEIIDEYVYSFGSGAYEVTGLSWKGVKEVARRMGNIEIRDLHLVEKENLWIAQCKAIDHVNRFELYGAAQQSKTMQLKTGEQKPDPFALPKVVSKAQRNALRNIIPETIVKKVLIQILGEEKVSKKIVKKTKGFHV